MCLGIPGQVVEIIDPAEHRATVEVDGVRREVNVG
ncbi:MAG: HypC/HybG/HupF family hydrogenase formation chaperone, partial [Acidimicrobiales bacterium]